jgi:uncharacterized protein (TIGR02646 family)
VIRIHKSDIIPDRLLKQGKAKRKEHCTDYSRNPEAYRSGEKKFSFDSTIYAHFSVKELLIRDHYGKCCYCERLVGQEGDVEHFRPKSAIQNKPGDSPQRPGYYWLVYDWQNLYFSCKPCNQLYKRTFFPLQSSATRATNHTINVEQEDSVLIDPGKEDPETMIGFRGEVPYAIENNERGMTTIDVLNLKTHNKEARRKHLRDLKTFYDSINLLTKNLDDLESKRLLARCITRLEEAIQPQAEFSAAARSAIATQFQYVSD